MPVKGINMNNCAAMALLALLPCIGLSQPSAADVHWKWVVVYERRGDTFRYLGALRDRVLSVKKTPGLVHSILPPRTLQYEVRLLRENKQMTLLYDPKSKVTIDGSSGSRLRILANGTDALASAIKEAAKVKVFKTARRAKADMRSSAIYPSGDETLRSLVHECETIVLVKVLGVWRMAHTPYHSTGPEQHTVALATVEELFKGKASPTFPLIKIHQQGGNLIWRDANGEAGRGLSVDGNPLLSDGEEYLLFLQSLPLPGTQKRGPFPIASALDGSIGQAAEWDEYVFPWPLKTKIFLFGGRTLSADPLQDWRFLEGPQLLGLTKKDAINTLTAVIKADAEGR